MTSCLPPFQVEYVDEASFRARLSGLDSIAAKSKLVSHVYCWDGKLIDCSASDTRFTNHDIRPTTSSHPTDVTDYDTYATRDIQPGEEITEDYGMYQTETVPWYKPLCAEYGVMSTDEVAAKFSNLTPFVSTQ